MKLKRVHSISAMLALLGVNLAAASEPFLAGADMSHAKFFEDRGITYRSDGQPEEVFDILKDRGLNCVRLRLFTSSASQAAADPYNYINNLDYTLPVAVRVKNAGLKFLLDYHFSDSWADPGKQFKPADWTGLDFNELAQQVRTYCSNTVSAFAAAGAMPDYVQIGNEIIGGLVWDDGRVGGSFDNPVQWSRCGQLLKSAIQGVNDASGSQPPRIIIHIDRGGDWGATRWFFDHINEEQVPYDIIGESFYAWWHGDLSDLTNCLTRAADRYGKPVMIMETAFPWTSSTYDPNLGIPATPEGQVQYASELAGILKDLPDGLGAGIFWWGSEYVQLNGYNLAGFDRTSFFDSEGNTLPVVRTLGQLSREVRIKVGLQGGNLQMEWPLSGAGMSLMTTTSPAPPALWLEVTNPVQNAAGTYNVTVPIEGDATRYYRLQSN